MSSSSTRVVSCSHLQMAAEMAMEVRAGEVEERTAVKFDPPVGTQRYMAVCQILSRDPSIHKVVDFGCSTGQFFKYLKRLEQVKQFAGVDISYSCLESACRLARPLVWECIYKRDFTLAVQFFRGSVASRDSRLQGFDAVTCIELVEHLHEDDLRELPKTIFGFVQPKVAVMTTPNRDFNVVFPDLQGMRHWDHKFEWSREEFESWCSEILRKYPDYTVEYTGVGEDPTGKFQSVGHCSQIAVFRRLVPKVAVVSLDISASESHVYELVSETVHPGKNG